MYKRGILNDQIWVQFGIKTYDMFTWTAVEPNPDRLYSSLVVMLGTTFSQNNNAQSGATQVE